MKHSSPWRRPAAALNLAGATLFLAGLALTPWETEETSRAYHDALAGSPDQSQAAALVLWLAYLSTAAGAYALIGVVGGGRPSWLRRIATVLVVLGATSMPGLLITDAYDLAMAQALPRESSVPISDAVGETVLAGVIGATAALGFIVGPLLLWIAAWRQRLVPGAVPALVGGGWIVGYATLELPVMLAGASLLIAATGLAAASLWREPPSAAASAHTGLAAEGEPGVHLEPVADGGSGELAAQ